MEGIPGERHGIRRRHRSEAFGHLGVQGRRAAGGSADDVLRRGTLRVDPGQREQGPGPVSYTHLRAHETRSNL
eukprot:16057592-Heterocapsa_arctica.AAC.1